MGEEKNNSFHKLALQTSLFKGRLDLYYCYIKSEKVALALAKLFPRSEYQSIVVLEMLRHQSASIPSAVAKLASSDISPAAALSLLFETRASLQLVAAELLLSEENTSILLEAYEEIIRKISGGAFMRLMTFQDLAMPEIAETSALAVFSETNKGHSKGQPISSPYKRQSTRTEAILKIIQENKHVSIKDISKIVRDCSEKTIQRELIGLMQQGLVRKEGERRWSMYLPA